MGFRRDPSRLLALALVLGATAGAARPGPGEPARTPARSAAEADDAAALVVTYNIHAGKDADGRPNLTRVATVLDSVAADIVLLQEVDRGTARSGGVDQLAELRRLTGMHGVFGRSLFYDGGEYGIAMLSRWPILESRVVPLRADPPEERAGEAYEPRVALFARVDAPAGPLLVVNTHLGAGAAGTYRRQELVALLAELNRVAGRRGPVVLGGDLNATPESDLATAATLPLDDAFTRCGTGDGATFPARAPDRRIDYVLLRGLDCTEATVAGTTASDHRPLVVRLRVLADAAPREAAGDEAGPPAGRLAQGSSSSLRFRPDGTFRIVQFTDTQDDQGIDPRTVRLLEAVLDDQRPDLVVFTGDNVRAGPETAEDVWAAIDHIAGPPEDRGIPWLVTFGNHDEDHTGRTGVDESAMLARYMSYPHNVNRAGPTGVAGTGNMHLLVRASDSDEPVLNLWALDSGRYAENTIGGQAIADDGLPGWDVIGFDQVAWYHQTSSALERRYGAPIPALAFFHIPLPEFGFMWDHRENHGVVGEKNERVSAGPFNSGLFAAMLERGDVKGVFVGHDHVNDYVGDYFGIRLGYSANSGFGTYGLDGDERDRLRGARVFVVREEDPGAFETFMVRATDYGIR